ncbi:putative bifunctional diguanylate cyclase/phosphodiesterase [Hyphomicrobium sp.]|uniref:putative bifunctional diguanylate cyclase/phosphodiesterase n=1 Tax=Hyphomicrobium sp. TaxID=82 RepID=UPI002E2FBFDC|nr:EAL domain-containing protein [Hyphomicrobium sp.]HEX2840944.1 EAL domain-containing protein [Hyphomicrobium sp.]
MNRRTSSKRNGPVGRRPLRAALRVLRGDVATRHGADAAAQISELEGALQVARTAVEAARTANARLREAIDILPQGIVFLDSEGRYVLWNEQYAQIYHRSADLFKVGARLADTLREGVMRGDYPAAVGREEEWIAERLEKLKTPSERHEQWLADGRCILIDERHTSEGGVIGLRVDITQLKEREASFRMLFEANPVPMYVVAQTGKTILSANAAARNHYGYPGTEMIGRPVDCLHLGPEHGSLEDLYSPAPGILADHVWTHLKRDGSQIEVALYSQAIEHERTSAVLVAAVDITERRRAEAQVAYLAHHDPLTGLANRTRHLEHADEMLRSVAENGGIGASLCIGIDNFKSVNETMGPAAGDQLLQAASRRIAKTLRQGSSAARLGGDEFGIIMPDVADPEEVSAVAKRLIDVISSPFRIQGQRVSIGASIGIAVAPNDGHEAGKLLKNANLALSQVKLRGKGAFRYFEPEMNARAQERHRLERDLRAALENNALQVHYQPLVCLSTGRIVAAEALVRWEHEERGYVSPAEFIPIAEEAGLIGALGQFVLRRACHHATAWPETMRVAVNLSPIQFRCSNVRDMVQDVLSATGLNPDRLELEITESLFLDRSNLVLDTLAELRKLGTRIAMDDFGTGYSSLGYLCSFPFDKIKIDSSFVHGISTNVEQQAVVRAIVGLGQTLGKTITAEGIETDAELACLRGIGCDQGQGFLFSKARPQDALLPFITKRKPKRVA